MEENLTDVLRIQGVNAKGYGSIPKLVMQDPRLTRDAKAIYAYMCSFAGAGDTAFPSVKKICQDLGFKTIETMSKHRKLLEKYGYIKVEQERDANGKFAKNIYTLVQFPTEQEEPKDENSPGDESLPSKNSTESENFGLGKNPIPQKSDSKNNRSFKINRSTKKITTTTTTNLDSNQNLNNTQNHDNVVVVDKPLEQSIKEPELRSAINGEIKEIQKLAKAAGINLTKKNIHELWIVARGDTEQIINGILAAVQYAQNQVVRDMWGLIKKSVADGRLPAVTPVLNSDEMRKKEDKYRDVYVC